MEEYDITADRRLAIMEMLYKSDAPFRTVYGLLKGHGFHEQV